MYSARIPYSASSSSLYLSSPDDASIFSMNSSPSSSLTSSPPSPITPPLSTSVFGDRARCHSPSPSPSFLATRPCSPSNLGSLSNFQFSFACPSTLSSPSNSASTEAVDQKIDCLGREFTQLRLRGGAKHSAAQRASTRGPLAAAAIGMPLTQASPWIDGGQSTDVSMELHEESETVAQKRRRFTEEPILGFDRPVKQQKGHLAPPLSILPSDQYLEERNRQRNDASFRALEDASMAWTPPVNYPAGGVEEPDSNSSVTDRASDVINSNHIAPKRTRWASVTPPRTNQHRKGTVANLPHWWGGQLRRAYIAVHGSPGDPIRRTSKRKIISSGAHRDDGPSDLRDPKTTTQSLA